MLDCILAMLQKQGSVEFFSFEPSVFNIELLSRNIYINKLYDNISIIPLPLTENVSISNMNMSSTDWGGALSTFGKDYTHDGKKLQKKFEFSVIGLSMDQCVSLLNIPKPDYIKMDVDGIEHLILKGGKDILKGVKSIILEINEDFEFQAREAPRLLRESGLTFKEKRHSEMFDAGEFQNTYNQIWVR